MPQTIIGVVDKSTGDQLTAVEVNEIKDAVNANANNVIEALAAESLDNYYNEFTYTGGALSKIESYESAAKISKLFTKTFSYDAEGNLTQMELTNESTATTISKTFAYDAGGNLASVTK